MTDSTLPHSTLPAELPATLLPPISTFIAAVNAFDLDGIVATFAADALVNDARRELWGLDAIRAWVANEIVGARVTMAVTEVITRPTETVIRARYDGLYDKTNLPPELILTSYVTVRDGKIATMFIIHNR
jgi:ketosteroid isomerase-like protein